MAKKDSSGFGDPLTDSIPSDGSSASPETVKAEYCDSNSLPDSFMKGSGFTIGSGD